jgi:3-oxoadipate enol-lactonase
MNYQIQGLSIHAEVHGTAEPALVFLHYWGGTSRTWRKVRPSITKAKVALRNAHGF